MTTILVVDDMAIFREPLAALLRQEGYRVNTAINGVDALRAVGEQPPDLILLDAAMPTMDGLTFCKHLRSNKQTARIPVIMLTAITDRSVVVKAAQLGVQGYLLKTQSSTQEPRLANPACPPGDRAGRAQR